eukprot:CAMPEP_0116877866 /NCGR_PEP_ID=MMETSP0463-20121206/9609_1 /TAXON_ID=181622 /ORGANISM="Strombidinopsis sp, Strain SopsisLIS2011" /LENGTH=59 /DNA_ID=CAMNT_0004525501 /DNA_START=2132 /DNA_END=2311 /DNA_ORIENTATION=-
MAEDFKFNIHETIKSKVNAEDVNGSVDYSQAEQEKSQHLSEIKDKIGVKFAKDLVETIE